MILRFRYETPKLKGIQNMFDNSIKFENFKPYANAFQRFSKELLIAFDFDIEFNPKFNRFRLYNSTGYIDIADPLYCQKPKKIKMSHLLDFFGNSKNGTKSVKIDDFKKIEEFYIKAAKLLAINKFLLFL